ncbi:MAG: HAMP domain-containing histidine kinase [Desulfobulbaceae bacterium]|uniref:histidine kinase n=1 Tax=Candidatus Desulfatifera sulfidica TaxID=2841691 RepID=A0A8J6TC45_9BACT|nr:HAMP domain-containing histidine kinase [Candidatus Desulfatifera sulfidica]
MSPSLVFIIYLGYGAAFFAIGVAITSRHKTFTNVRIAGLFWLLAAFAFLHGSHEWMEMFRHLQIPGTEPLTAKLRPISLSLVTLSFLFLFLFGINLHGILHPRTRPWLFTLLFLLLCLSGYLIVIHRFLEINILVQIIEYDLRKLLAFPATLLTGSGFCLYARRLRRQSLKGAGNFTGAGIAFIAYGFWAGLIPSGSWILLPVEVWRGLSAFIILHFIMYALDNFLDEREAIITRQLHIAARSEKLSAVGRLAAGIAHEINNPLTNVSLHLELLAKDPTIVNNLTAKATERLKTITRNIDKSAAIAQELLIFAGQPDNLAEPELIQLTPIINSAWQLASHRSKNHTLHCELGQAETVTGIPLKIEELFLNLFLNGMDAMPDGGTIEVTSTRLSEQTIITIMDRGTGILPEQLGLVMEPFFSTKDVGQGTGLGLAICYGIMELHNGSIEVTPRKDGGTVITLTFP